MMISARSTVLVTLLFLFVVPAAWSQCSVSVLQGDTVNVACGDSVLLSATGTGGFAINNNFNAGSAGFGWQTTAGVLFNNPCVPNPNLTTYMWMGAAVPAPRSLTTVALNVSCGGQVCFDLRMEIQGGASPCEGPDLPTEGIYFEWSPTGTAPWTQIFYFAPNPGGTAGPYTSWANYCYTIPVAAQTPGTFFRWIQTGSSGGPWDHWGLDEIQITNNCLGYNLVWSNGDTTDTTMYGPITQPVNYTVMQTNNVNDTCMDTVLVLPQGPTFTATTPELTVCPGAEVLLDTTNTSWMIPGVNYNLVWSPPGNLNDPTSSNPTATIYSEIDYVATVTHPDFPICVGVDTITIDTGNSLSFLSVFTNDENCGLAQGGIADGDITVNVGGGTTNYWYNYDNGLGFVNSNNASAVTNGTYNVVIIDSTSFCTIDTNLVINLIPGLNVDNLTATDASCNSNCDGTVKAVVSGAIGPATFNWVGTGNTGVGLDSISAVCGSQTYTLEVSDNLCVYTQQFTIDDPEELVLDLQLDDSLICWNEFARLDAIVTGGTQPYTFLWNVLSDQATHQITPDTSGVYSVQIVDVNNCSTTVQAKFIDVYPEIVTQIVSDTVCPEDPAEISISATGGNGNYVYTWSGNVSNDSVLNTLGDSASLTYLVTVSDGCVPVVVDEVPLVIYDLPNVDFMIDNDSSCVPATVDFAYSTSLVKEAAWDFGNGYKDDSIWLTEFPIVYEEAGIYTISLDMVSVDGCTLSRVKTLEVFDQPTAQFDWDSTIQLDVVYNELALNNRSENASTFDWYFPNGHSDEDNPIWKFEVPKGKYPIRMVASNGVGCVDEVTYLVDIWPRGGIWVPNTFSPNKDGINERFLPKMDAVDESTYVLRVYNRWGELLFHTADVNQGWDGGNHQEGMYIYQLDVLPLYQEEFVTQRGEVRLIR